MGAQVRRVREITEQLGDNRRAATEFFAPHGGRERYTLPAPRSSILATRGGDGCTRRGSNPSLSATGSNTTLVGFAGMPAGATPLSFVGMLFVSIVCLSVGCTPTAGSPSHPARGPATPGIAIASPKVNAICASFATGANKPHRTTADGLQISDVDTGSGTGPRSGDLLTV